MPYHPPLHNWSTFAGMTTACIVIFWTCLGLYIYSYMLYPLIMEAWHAMAPERPTLTTTSGPATVEVLIAAYNEEKVISNTLESIAAQEFEGNLRVTVGSDSSTDRTDQIVQELSSRDNRFHLEVFSSRTGKPGIINALAKKSTADILVMMDADIELSSDALQSIVGRFADSDIRVVSPRLIPNQNRTNESTEADTTYLNMETRLKYLEGEHLGKVMGAFGACYAIRRANYHPVPPNHLVDDFYITLKAVSDGGRSVVEPQASIYENTSSGSEEFRRRRRISTGNFQNLFAMPELLNPVTKTGWGYISHKVLRWTLPAFSLLAIIALAYLSIHDSFYLAVLIVGVGCYLLSLAASRLNNVSSSILSFPSHFAHMNAATLLGLKDFMIGIRSSIWEPTHRDQN